MKKSMGSDLRTQLSSRYSRISTPLRMQGMHMKAPERSYGIIRWDTGNYQVVGQFGVDIMRDHAEVYHGMLIATDLTEEEAEALLKLLPQDE
jgi:hypothetical protein